LLKVSIVTISYNQRKFLERTILSVLNQDYPNIEYIVVDPGSTDGSRELIDQYGSNISKTIFEADQGPADGLNKGFKNSQGAVLAFLNSDDVLHPGATSAAVRFLRARPGTDVVSGNAEIIDKDDRVLRRTFSDRMSTRKYVYGAVTIIQPSTFFTRIAFEKTAGFNVMNRVSWDAELFLDMAIAGCNFGLSNEIWSGYRLHAGTITTSRNLAQARKEIDDQHFRRVIGRNRLWIDDRISTILRVWKHLTNPRDTAERLIRGPIAGRTVSESTERH